MNVTETWMCNKCRACHPTEYAAVTCFDSHYTGSRITQWFKCGKCEEGYPTRDRAENCCKISAQHEWATEHGAKVYGEASTNPRQRNARYQCIWKQGGILHIVDSYESGPDAIRLAYERSQQILKDFGV